MKRTLQLLTFALALTLWAGALWAWPRLPEQIPRHFGVNGLPDAWGPRSAVAWFGLPAVALLLTALLWTLGPLMRRYPRLVNLPGGQRLETLPAGARARVIEVVQETLMLLGLEVLLILGLIQLAEWRAAVGEPDQRLVLAALVLALVSSPFFLVVFVVRTQRALDAVERRARAGRSGGA